MYPSEGIHKRWDSGYRITSTAANIDQSALVLSVPKRRPGDETQETLRTSQFPSTHVKVNVISMSMLLRAGLEVSLCQTGVHVQVADTCIL